MQHLYQLDIKTITMKKAIYLIILILVFGCRVQKRENENPKYSQEIEDKIKRVTENLKVQTQFWNQYENSTLEERLSHYKTPGISIGVINNGVLEWARGFGYRNLNKNEPVTQNTLRIVDALYSLDVSLANRRHFPAINWLTSYSLYAESVKDWWSKDSPEWERTRATALKLLQQEAELEEIVRLVGPEALPDGDKLVLLVARMIREDFLMQSAYHAIDTYCLPARAHYMLKTIIKFYELARRILDSGASATEIQSSPLIYRISRMKDIPHDVLEQRIKEIWAEMETSLSAYQGGI